MDCLLMNLLASLRVLKSWIGVGGVKSVASVQTRLLPTLQTTSHKLTLCPWDRSCKMEPI